MQFFPSDIFSAAFGTATGGLQQFGNSPDSFAVLAPSAPKPSGKASGFKDIFDKLSAYNENNNTGAVPLTTASTRDKKSLFNSEDFKVLKGKLQELGVSEEVIDQYFVYMSAVHTNPTIGNMRASAQALLEGTSLEGLTKQEFVQFSSMLSKMDFSNDEIKEIEELMHKGNGHGILEKIKEKLQAFAKENKDVELSREDLDVLLKACNIHANLREPILKALESLDTLELSEDGMIKFNTKSFDLLFDTTLAKLEKLDLELRELSGKLNEAIESMLSAKKQRPEEPVSDVRGSALASRSETMAKILATLINEEDKEENSTSHLIEDKGAAKTVRKESILASLADDKMTSKSVKEERQAEARAELRGEKAEPQNAAFAASSTIKGVRPEAASRENTARSLKDVRPEAASRENAERSLADLPLHDESASRPNDGRNDDGKHKGNLFSGQQPNGPDADAAKAAFSAKVREDGGVVFSVFNQTENSSAAGQSNQANQSAKTDMYNERIFDQIERGIVKNATDGSKQIVLRLDPPELGKLTLSLTVAQGEVKAVIRTESTATTQVVSEQLAQLKQSLEEQGFKVSSLEVETRAESHAGTDNWNGAEQHNQEQQLLEQTRFLRLSRVRAKEGDALAQSVQHVESTASISASGLHIIA